MRLSSDDLWMFASRALTSASGIQPNALYDVTMTAWIASNARWAYADSSPDRMTRASFEFQ